MYAIVSASLSTVVAASVRALHSCLQHSLQMHQCSRWLKFRNEGKVSDFIIACPSSVCAGELTEHEKVVFHSNEVDLRDELADPTAFEFAIEHKNAPRRRQSSTSTSSRIVLMSRACSWSENAWDPALECILMSSVETTDKRSKVQVPSTAVMDIHRSMKSHVKVLLRRQAPCPRNRQSRPCVKTVRAAGRSPQLRSSPTVWRLLEQLQNPISASLSCRRWPGHVMVAAWRRTLSNRPPERNSSRWRGISKATSRASSSRRTRTT